MVVSVVQFSNLNIVRLNGSSRWFLLFSHSFIKYLFITYWVCKMIGEVRNTLRTKMGKIYLYICLCGNKIKFEKEKEMRKIEDENDIVTRRI